MSYIHMEGNVPGSDVGYVFPGGADVTGLRETRTQKWTLMNTYEKFYYDQDVTNSFITMYLDHGTDPVDASYQYIILPGKSEAETADYSANADVEILANTDTVHAVREKTLGITAVNFFEAGACPEAQVSADKPASIMFGTDKDGSLTVSVTDVTNKASGAITVTLDFPVEEVLSCDDTIQVERNADSTVLTVDVTGSRGQSRTVTFAPAPVSAESVSLDKDSLRLEEGDTYTLTATVEPSDATNKTVTWSSSDTDVATVDQNGKVRAKDPGTAIITVTTEDGGHTATCKVTVYEYDDGGSSSGGSSSRPESRYDVELDVTGGSANVSNTRPKAGDRVTVTLRPDAGMELERIEAVTEDGDTVKLTKMDEDEYTFRQPADDVTVRVVFTAVETEPEVEFGDVKDSDWFAAAVEYVVEKGLMQGVGADLFQPQGLTDRAMVVTILYRLEGEPAVTGGQSFPDVAPGTWYAEAVRWASSEGIVDGYADGTFGPTDPVTREQLAAILYRYAGKPAVEGESKTFADSANISSWAVEAMEWAVKSGVLSGKNGDLLDPTGTATRAEVAQILMNFCENVK